MTIYKVFAVTAALLISVFSFAQEKKIKRTDLPRAVEKSLQDQLKGATVKGFSKEKEKGHVVYEAELIVEGHTKDIQFDANGNVQEVEEEVVLDTLPPGVKAGLMTQAKGASITKVESLTKQNRLVAYEAAITRSGKKTEIQVGSKGERLNHEE